MVTTTTDRPTLGELLTEFTKLEERAREQAKAAAELHDDLESTLTKLEVYEDENRA